MPLRRAAPSSTAVAAPKTAHQLAIAAIDPMWHVPFDGRLSGGLPLNLTSNSYPSGTTFSYSEQDFVVKECLCVDGVGTGFRRMFNTAVGNAGALLLIPNSTELMEFSWGISVSISPSQINWADGSDWGFNPNEWCAVATTHGMDLNYHRNNENFYAWTTGVQPWSRGVGSSFLHPNGFRLVMNVKKNDTCTLWINGSRASQFFMNWNAVASSSKNGNIEVGCPATVNLGRHHAVRDYWFKPALISQAQARSISA